MNVSTLSIEQIKNLAQQHQMEIVGALGSKVPGNEEAEKRLESWQQKGHHGEMAYMGRSANLFVDIKHFLPPARSLLSFFIPYSRTSRPNRPSGYGRIARYAWGRDYHRILKKKLKQFVRSCEELTQKPIQYRIFSDAVPLLERHIAASAQLGFIGKNTMLIRPGSGSYSFLGEIIWDLEVQPLEEEKNPAGGGCGTCTRCLDICPTGAFETAYELNARKCISYLTIEKDGKLNDWESEALGEWVFGCDLCQEICPFNYATLKRRDPGLDEFSPEKGSGTLLDLAHVLTIRSDEEYQERFAGTPLMRAKREGLLRNAAIVAANTGAISLIEPLKRVSDEDSSEVVRYHAQRAVEVLR